MKVIIWKCLRNELERVLEKGNVTFNVDTLIGGLLCTQLASDFEEYNDLKLNFPIIFINNEKRFSGIWIVFDSVEEAEEFAKRILDEVKRYREGWYDNEVKTVKDKLIKEFGNEYTIARILILSEKEKEKFL